MIIIVAIAIMIAFVITVVTVGLIIIIMRYTMTLWHLVLPCFYRKKYNNGKTESGHVYDVPDISLKEVKPQTVDPAYDEVKIDSTVTKEPVSDYEVPVTAITEDSVDIATQCNEAYSIVKTQ